MIDNKIKLIDAVLSVSGCCKMTILGTSMSPILHNGQVVIVEKMHEYHIGDILIFKYKDQELLAHRLLLIKENSKKRFFCKGDNSFRLEDILENDIIGRVVLDFDKNNNPKFIQASYKIAKLFKQYKYDKKLVLDSPEYKEYYNTYL